MQERSVSSTVSTLQVDSSPAGFGAFVPGPRLIVPPTSAGSMDGLTFAVKDLIDVAGVGTGGGNPDWLKTHEPATT